MEDHDTGARAPEVGVSRASPLDSASSSAGRHHDRHAGPGGRHAPGDAQQQKGKTRKRRKRRRGRKVFARDDNQVATAGQPAPGASAP
ncbi:Ppx/GppA family phosphatase, partial [Mesorhizobium sp. M4B.F.Ca.ET.013.02.1.1]